MYGGRNNRRAGARDFGIDGETSKEGMQKFHITEAEEIEYAISRGVNPFFSDLFTIDKELRRDWLKAMFPKNTEKNNIRFYKWVWEGKNQHYCSECGIPLERYNSAYISHRWSRGAHPEMAFEPRNTDILCMRCHNKFESPITRKDMKIYPRVAREMEELRKEYNESKD